MKLDYTGTGITVVSFRFIRLVCVVIAVYLVVALTTYIDQGMCSFPVSIPQPEILSDKTAPTEELEVIENHTTVEVIENHTTVSSNGVAQVQSIPSDVDYKGYLRRKSWKPEESWKKYSYSEIDNLEWNAIPLAFLQKGRWEWHTGSDSKAWCIGQRYRHCCQASNCPYVGEARTCKVGIQEARPGDGYTVLISSCGRCKCQFRERTEFGHFEWSPSSTLQFDGRHFCDLLGDRHLYIIGDSIAGRFTSTFVQNVVDHCGECASQVVYQPSDFLAPSPKHIPAPERYVSLDRYISKLNGTSSVVLLTTGPHYNDENNFVTGIDWIADYLEFVRKDPGFANVEFYWKTGNAHHYNCGTRREPLKAVQNETELNILVDSFYQPIKKWGYTKHLHKYNIYAILKLWDVVDGFLDTTPQFLRPDGHADGDCLHSCYHPDRGSYWSFVAKIIVDVLNNPRASRLYQ